MKPWINIELNASPVNDGRYIKIKMKTHGVKVYTCFRDLNPPEDDIWCASFTVISHNSLLVCKNQYYLQVYLNNCAYKIIDKRIIDYLAENPLETDEN